MNLKLADLESQYSKDKDLKKVDVEALIDWVNKQPHLPKINELQAILFLHSCYYSNEAAKVTIDNYFTSKTVFHMFRNRDPSSPPVQTTIDIALCANLPKTTPEGYTVYLFKLINKNPSNFNLENIYRYFDMMVMLERYQNGVSNGHVILLDCTGWSLGHTARVNPLVLKNFFYYLQEAMPVRLKGLHFYNLGSFIDAIMALIKPLLKKETAEKIHIHDSLDSVTNFVCLECLPEDYGGSVESTTVLHDKIQNDLLKNKAFFEWEETFTVDEKKRPGEKWKNIDIYGTEGTFKKLEID
ncbi:hypothetical protein Zmor_017838 [Zophobas morio]|uniref:CRAL-TRIO domain-containing protein n=1 Tax=Zophobas morio TaxID=2755281 RepID=A0AA38MCJ2_9CUCU|nr:hypothetical protein Zmor_017838 [Zophobas morio]